MSTPKEAQIKSKKKLLGEQLIEKGIVSNDQISIALIEQKKTNKPLGEVLIKLGFVSESIIREILSETFGRDSVDLTEIVPDPETLALVPRNVAILNTVFPISFDPNTMQLRLAMLDIYDVTVLDRVSAIQDPNISIIPVLSSEHDIKLAIDQFYGHELSIDGILKEISTGEIDHDSLMQQNDEYSHPLVRLVNAILADAVKQGASDIHIEPEEKFLRLRYRIDGVLRQIRSIHKDYWSPILIRIKVMANMNIAETRMPQDGRISVKVRGKQIDFRVAMQPVINGENIVLRVLDRSKGIIPLQKLNLPKGTLAKLKLLMQRPEGIILVTGPTGSGKTTTLYSMLDSLKSIKVNIMTLEDPVEYPMDLIQQTDLTEVSKMTFATGIRSIMRQDPDIILVGEIRDQETADMAFQAAMTGHRVFATLHTNSALGIIPRLTDIGVVPSILASNIIGVIAQRLVRSLCQNCKKSHQANESELLLLLDEDQKKDYKKIKKPMIYSAKGCEMCNFSGYKGRLSIMEILIIDDGIDELIARQASIGVLRKYAKSTGFKTMMEDAKRYILAGKTTIDEIQRVIGLN